MSDAPHSQQVAEIMDLLRPDYTAPERTRERRPARVQPSAPLSQFVGQPHSQQFGQVLKNTEDDGHNEHVNIGYRGPGADPYAVPFSHKTRYGLFNTEPPDDRPAAMLTMTRKRDHHFPYDRGPDTHDPVQRFDDPWDAKPQPHYQGTLFRSIPAKPWTVEEMYAHPEATHAIPTLMGLAAQHTLTSTGGLPQSSSDLSRHSTRLVHGLAKHGVIDAPKEESRNGLGFEDGARTADMYVGRMQRLRRSPNDALFEGEPSRQLSDSEVQRGSNTFRGILRGAKAARRSEFDSGTAHHPGQDVLPGMEHVR